MTIVGLLMAGFGDVGKPSSDSVLLMEEMLMDYIHDLCTETQSQSKTVRTKNVLFALRNDPKKLARAQELLKMEAELKAARQTFDITDV